MCCVVFVVVVVSLVHVVVVAAAVLSALQLLCVIDGQEKVDEDYFQFRAGCIRAP